MVPVNASCATEIENWLKIRCGRRLRVNPPRSDYLPASVDAVLITGAHRGAQLHLRGPTGWHVRPTAAEVMQVLEPHGSAGPSLAELPGIQLAVARLDAATAEFHGGRARRRVEAGDRTIANWLATHASAAYPGAASELAALIASPRCGDVILFAADGWTFAERFRAGHGSITRRDMIIPLYFAGGDLPPGTRIHHGRLVDVMPTVLELLGQPVGDDAIAGIDGRSLLPRLRAAEATSP
jgi:hypothetical protein